LGGLWTYSRRWSSSQAALADAGESAPDARGDAGDDDMTAAVALATAATATVAVL